MTFYLLVQHYGLGPVLAYYGFVLCVAVGLIFWEKSR